jgi:hypothetical protein
MEFQWSVTNSKTPCGMKTRIRSCVSTSDDLMLISLREKTIWISPTGKIGQKDDWEVAFDSKVVTRKDSNSAGTVTLGWAIVQMSVGFNRHFLGG